MQEASNNIMVRLQQHNPTKSWQALHGVWAESEVDLHAIDWLPLSHRTTLVASSIVSLVV